MLYGFVNSTFSERYERGIKESYPTHQGTRSRLAQYRAILEVDMHFPIRRKIVRWLTADEYTFRPSIAGSKIPTHMDVAHGAIEDTNADEDIELDRTIKAAQRLKPKTLMDSLGCDDGSGDVLIRSRTCLGPLGSSDGLLLTRAEMRQLAAYPRMLSQNSRTGIAPACLSPKAPNSWELLRTVASKG